MKRSTWILMAVFVVLVAAAVFLPQALEKAAKAAETPTPTLSPQPQPLLAFDAAAVTSITVSDALTTTVKVERSGDAWKLVLPVSELTDVAAVENAVTQLATLRILNQLDASVNLADLGLSTSAYTVTIGVQSGLTQTLTIGSETPSGRGYYIQMNGGSPMAVEKLGLQTVLNMLATPPIATPTALPPTSTPESVPADLPALTVTP